jgi:hypothetical protein
MMGQIVHVFRKDIRRHWREVVLSIAILAAFAWIEPSQWVPQRSPEVILRMLLHQWLTPMVAIAWLLLIERVVHGESLVGDRQFWVTRPYQWQKLLIAKAVFMLVFINVPLFVAQVTLLWKASFAPARYVTGLLWMQCLWLIFLILPMTTLAAVTSGLGQTVLALLGILLSMIGLAAFSSVIPDIGLPAAQRIPGWFQPTILLGACVVVIWWQYARRRTLHSRFLAIAGGIVLLVTAVTPHQSLDAHAYTQTSSGQQLPVRLAFDPAKSAAAGGAQMEKDKVYVQIPLLVSGTERDSVVGVDGMMVEIRTPNGLRWNSGWFRSSLFLVPGQTHTEASFAVDKVFFEQTKSSSANIQISFALTLFQAKETHRIKLATGEFSTPGNAWCSVYPETPTLQCRSPLKTPFLLVTTLSDESTCPLQENEKRTTPETVFSALNWNPEVAPAEFGISPVQTFSLRFSQGWRTSDEVRARLCPGTPMVFGRPEQSQRTRRELVIEGIRLVDYQLKNLWAGDTAIGIAVH